MHLIVRKALLEKTKGLFCPAFCSDSSQLDVYGKQDMSTLLYVLCSAQTDIQRHTGSSTGGNYSYYD